MSVIVSTGSGMAKNNCSERALRSAFKFAQVPYPIEIPVDIMWTDNLIQFCKNLGLEVYTNGVVCADARPVLAIYKVPNPCPEDIITVEKLSNGKCHEVFHSVFVQILVRFSDTKSTQLFSDGKS